MLGRHSIPNASWTGITSIVGDQAKSETPWGTWFRSVTAHDYMLSVDSQASARQKRDVRRTLYQSFSGLNEFTRSTSSFLAIGTAE